MIELVKNDYRSFNKIRDLKEYLDEQGGKSEFVEAKLNDITINEEGLRVNKRNFGLKKCGLQSLMTRIKMPTEFAKRIPTDLFVTNVNRLIKEQPNRHVTVNILGNNVRAVHSGIYLPITNKEIVDNLKVPKEIKPKIRRINVSDESMSIALTSQAKTIKMGVGDIVECGGEINNSETGYMPCSISQYLHQLICTNGATVAGVADSVRKVHSGYQEFDAQYYIGALVDFMSTGAEVYNGAFKAMKDNQPTAKMMRKLETEIRINLGKQDTQELVEQWDASNANSYKVYSDITLATHSRKLPFSKQHSLEKIGGQIVKEYL